MESRKRRMTVFVNPNGTVIKTYTTGEAFTPMNKGEKVLLKKNDITYIITEITHIPHSVTRLIEIRPHVWEKN